MSFTVTLGYVEAERRLYLNLILAMTSSAVIGDFCRYLVTLRLEP